MNIIDSLRENDSIQLKKHVNNWEEAIEVLFAPLVSNGSVTEEYPTAIIERTKELGPFYVLGGGVAMPHERGEKGALKDSFCFLTLDEQVEFPTGEKIDILIGFGATNSEVHIAEAIPQIVTLFEDEDSFDEIRKKTTSEEILEHIANVLG